jgi:hypothetical protein
MMKIQFIILLSLAVSPTIILSADWYIDTLHGSDSSSDGTNNTTPLQSFQTAVNLASNGDTIYVFPGIYHSSNNNSRIAFYGKSLVIESISGPLLTIIDCHGFNHGPIFQYEQDTSPRPVLRGLTIRNCGCVVGCGVFVIGQMSAPPLLDNMMVYNNIASLYGGAIYGYSNPSVVSTLPITLVNCVFRNNSAQIGASLYFSFMSRIEILSSQFIRNLATSTMFVVGSNVVLIQNSTWDSNNGGSIHLDTGGWLSLSFTNLTRNNALDTSTIYLIKTPFTITSCHFIQNTGFNGSCIHSSASTIISSSSISSSAISSSTFQNNIALSTGGALYFSKTFVSVDSTYFIRNKATVAAGAIYTNDGLQMDSCIWFGNSANKLGGSLLIESASTIIKPIIIRLSRFENSSATESGGAIHLAINTMLLLNDSNLISNKATNFGGAIATVGKSTALIIHGCFFMFNASPGQPHSALSSTITGLGGAIYHGGTGKLVVLNSQLNNNEAGTQGGAISIVSNTQYTLQSLTLARNIAVRGGGGGIALSPILAGVITNKTLDALRRTQICSDCIWTNNMGIDNQNDTGSLPAGIQWSTPNTGYPLQNAQSAQTYNVSVKLVDGFGNIGRDGGYNKTILVISTAYIVGGGGLILPNLTNGEGQFSIRLVGTPGQNYTISLFSVGTGLLVPTTYTFSFAQCTDRERKLPFVEQNSDAGLGSLLNTFLNSSNTALSYCEAIPDYSMSNTSVGAFSISCIILEILFIMMMVFAWRYREDRAIKQSSYWFCQLITFGCIIVLIPYLHITPTTNYCMLRIWCFHLGFTLAYGSLFWKTYRLHAIFFQKQLKKIGFIRDHELLQRLFIFILVDTFLLLLWTVWQSPYTITESYTCESVDAPIFYPLMTALKGMYALT